MIDRFILPQQQEAVRQIATEQPGVHLVYAVGFGLLTGLVESAVMLAEKYFMHKLDKQFNPDTIWMAPLANMLIFATIGFVLSLLAWHWKRLASVYWAKVIFLFLTFSALLLKYDSLDKLAVLVLAAGLSTQVSHVMSIPFSRFFRVDRSIFRSRTKRAQDRMSQAVDTTSQNFNVSRRQFLLGSGATVVGLAMGVKGWETITERRKIASLAPPLHNSPNILLLVLDTVRAQSLSLYGHVRRTTPQLERFAERCVLFDRAIATAPWTLPSHSSMFTGRWHHEVSSDWLTPLDDSYPTLAEVLNTHGYLTAGFVANLSYCGHVMGLSRGFIHYEDFPVSIGQILLSSSLGQTINSSDRLHQALGYHELLNRKTAEMINDSFLHWLSRRDAERPFFAFLNYFDAHEPYLPPAPFDVMFDGPHVVRNNFQHEAFDAVRDKRGLSLQEIQAEVHAYEEAIAYLDHHVGLLIDELERRGILDNTVVIVTSDHGEEFGEHGAFEHGETLYLPAIHVPLMISYPSNIPTHMQVNEPVSLRNLPATIMDIIGVDSTVSFPGYSLRRHWENQNHSEDWAKEPVLAEVNVNGWDPNTKRNLRSLVMGKYHYIKYEDGREELYDIGLDPSEEHDLAQADKGRRTVEQLRELLETLLVSSHS